MTSISGDDDSYDEIDKDWSKIWHNDDGERHRDGDLPALIYTNGSVEYYKDGNPHRDGDLPAVIYANGKVEYWVDGVRQK